MPESSHAILWSNVLDQARRIHGSAALILSAGILTALALKMPVSLGVQIALLSVSVLVLGIPHGAMDHRVAEWVLRDRLSGRWMPVFLITYCSLAGLMLLIWFSAPWAALEIFLILSALHFGLGDVKDIQNNSAGCQLLLAFTRGVIPIGLPIIFHCNEVNLLFGWLTSNGHGANGFAIPGLFPSAVLITIPAFLFHLGRAVVKQDWSGTGELCILALVGSILPPLISFAVYFGLWHSPRHLMELACWREQQLDGRSVNGKSEAISFVSGLRRVAWEAVPLTVVTWLLMAVGFRIVRNSFSVDASTVRVIFVSLSALTVPHMLLTFAAEHKSLDQDNSESSSLMEPI